MKRVDQREKKSKPAKRTKPKRQKRLSPSVWGVASMLPDDMVEDVAGVGVAQMPGVRSRFDLLAVFKQGGDKLSGDKVVSLHGVPKYLKVTFERFQKRARCLHDLKIETGAGIASCLVFGLESLIDSPQVQRFVTALEAVETDDNLCLEAQVQLAGIVDGFRFSPEDPYFSSPERWSFRCSEVVTSDLYARKKVLRMELGPLAATCIGMTLAQQSGVDRDAADLMKATFNNLKGSFLKRGHQLEGLRTLFGGKD